jgi:hypothetical protein
MPPPPDIELLPCEDRIILIAQAMKSDASLSSRRAAAAYGIPRRTLRDRHAGITSRRDTHHGRSAPTKTKEDSLVQRIRDQSLHGFAPSYNEVRGMVDQLLAAQGGSHVGINWIYRLVRRRADIKSQMSRLRGLSSDPVQQSSCYQDSI